MVIIFTIIVKFRTFVRVKQRQALRALDSWTWAGAGVVGREPAEWLIIFAATRYGFFDLECDRGNEKCGRRGRGLVAGAASARTPITNGPRVTSS